MKSLSEIEELINKLKNGSNYVSKKIEDLIDEITDIRSKIALTVPIYDDSYSNIEVGESLSIIPETYTFTFNAIPTIMFSNFTLECDYSILLNNTILYKDNIDNYIKQMANDFVPTNYNGKIICEYDPKSTISFNDNDVPDNSWFKNTFYTKEEESIKYPLFINRKPFKIKESSIMTAKDVFYYGAVNLIDNEVNIAITDKANINGVNVSESMIEGINNSDIDIVLNNVEAQEANYYNSVVTLKALKNGYISKDLSNLESIYVTTNNLNQNSFVPINNLGNIFEKMNLLKSVLVPDKNFNLTYIEGGNTPQTIVSEIMFKFSNNDKDLIENPDKYISKLTAYGDKVKNEPVTLASINILLALIAHKKSNKSLIVTDSYYAKNILSIQNELKSISDYQFSVPVVFSGGDYIKVSHIKKILEV